MREREMREMRERLSKTEHERALFIYQVRCFKRECPCKEYVSPTVRWCLLVLGLGSTILGVMLLVVSVLLLKALQQVLTTVRKGCVLLPACIICHNAVRARPDHSLHCLHPTERSQSQGRAQRAAALSLRARRDARSAAGEHLSPNTTFC